MAPFPTYSIDEPIDWDRSYLAQHDVCFRRGTLVGARRGEIFLPTHQNTQPDELGPHDASGLSPSITSMIPSQQSTPVPPKDENNDDLVFVHWSDPRNPGPASRTLASEKFRCKDEGCDKTFSRDSDMLRHWESHRSGPKAYDCPANRCPRTGMKGFWRLDKLKAHLNSKHPEIDVQPWFFGSYLYFSAPDSLLSPGTLRKGGYLDVAKPEEHQVMMLSKGYTLVGDSKTDIIYALSEKVNALEERRAFSSR